MEKKLGRVLVVDDEKDILQIVKYNLELHCYEVETAENGVDAIEKNKSFKPELILLDIMMPHKDGIQTCIEIRANPLFDDTLIIFLTALSDEKSEIRGLEIGADDYIAKPIKPKLLVSRVHSAFRRINREDNHVMIFPNYITVTIKPTNDSPIINLVVIVMVLVNVLDVTIMVFV